MPIELGFILMRLAEMAEADESLRDRQPWKAAYEKDYGWLGETITKHYHGDDGAADDADGRDPPGLCRSERRGLLAPPPTRSCVREAPDARPRRSTSAATCRWSSCSATSRRTGSRTTSPPAATATSCGPSPRTMYGIPSERVIGSSNALAYVDDEHGGTISYQAEGGLLRRRPGQAGSDLEPHRQRPILAGGNSNGDIPMLRYAGGKDRPALRLLVLHDDDEREFAYTAGAETSLETCRRTRLDRRQRQERLIHSLH